MFPVEDSLLLAIYVLGSFLNAVTVSAVLFRTNWSKNPGLMLIVSLTLSDFIDSFLNMIGIIESLIVFLRPQTEAAFPVAIKYVIGYYGNVAWGVCTTHILVMAANRFIAVIFPLRFDTVFSARRTKILLLICWLLAIIQTSAHYVFCCPLVWEVHNGANAPLVPENSTYQFMGTDVAFSTMAVVIPTILYSAVAIRFLQLKSYSARSLASSASNNSAAEAWLCVQFAIVLAIYEAMNVSWLLADFGQIFISLNAVSSALNFTANPVVYLLFNVTVHEAVKKQFSFCLRSRLSNNPHSLSSNVVHPGHRLSIRNGMKMAAAHRRK